MDDEDNEDNMEDDEDINDDDDNGTGTGRKALPKGMTHPNNIYRCSRRNKGP
jgi:hypothetical protein